MDVTALLRPFELDPRALADGDLIARTPIDGSITARLIDQDAAAVAAAVGRAHDAFLTWRTVPAPRRGELVRLLGDELRACKDALAALVTVEAGKIAAEARGEVQEMIDICDFACGLSRQLYGLTIASERPGHRMSETWHPLGVVGVISAFNFPVAVWAWNFALAIACGDAVVWKPSEKTPLTALACGAVFRRALARFAAGGGAAPAGLLEIVIGGRAAGEALVDDPRVALVSATGSTRMGRAVAPRVAARFGRCLLELGGNNAMIVTPSADLDLATRAILFSAAGTAGQRCTTLRRLIVYESIRAELTARVERAYAQIRVGDPRDPATLVGPLIDQASLAAMQHALDRARADGGEVTGGAPVAVAGCDGGAYVTPALVRMPGQTAIVRDETFAPILYTIGYRDLDAAIAVHNDVPQGLSSCIFTTDVREAERFLSAAGSDCGIANVNIGPSGAEIGGAFGGEKETGGGRESGSDAWKSYMRRATNTVNYSNDLPLAQGITFG
ncbi:MAG TPA: aldehyde dehydrogenase family protein [Kofleriaceae bacterium]|nr:aldehyde dehydrogenase family protein [Kofleriaceae bacterium]